MVKKNKMWDSSSMLLSIRKKEGTIVRAAVPSVGQEGGDLMAKAKSTVRIRIKRTVKVGSRKVTKTANKTIRV